MLAGPIGLKFFVDTHLNILKKIFLFLFFYGNAGPFSYLFIIKQGICICFLIASQTAGRIGLL